MKKIRLEVMNYQISSGGARTKRW